MSFDSMRAHYDALLSAIYRWMLGDFLFALARSRTELESFGIGRARSGARGLDLGAGLGLQSIPLAELGYSVTAIDSSRELLAELAEACPEVMAVPGDIRNLDVLSRGAYDVIVCMGDTLTHLDSLEEVDALLFAACRKLVTGGTIALTFRDYFSSTRRSTDRFILVQADAHRILTCCLDYGDEHVQVTDILHEHRGDAWSMRASSYAKLRLSRDWVSERLRAHGVTVTRSESLGSRIIVVGNA
jgi:2-polyprenyl-3-methyl-5-hydroxy-6-metoxy-1,4-benzoquinol methylase